MPPCHLAIDKPRRLHQSFRALARCAFAALRGARRVGRRAACLAVSRTLPSRWRTGMAGWDLPSRDTGEVRGGAGGWARVKSSFIFPILTWGWGQCLAAMLAAQKLNDLPEQTVYGIRQMARSGSAGNCTLLYSPRIRAPLRWKMSTVSGPRSTLSSRSAVTR